MKFLYLYTIDFYECFFIKRFIPLNWMFIAGHASRNSTSNRHSLSFAPMSAAAAPGVGQTLDPTYQRSASYRVTPEREVPRSRSVTPQPGDLETKYTPPMFVALLCILSLLNFFYQCVCGGCEKNIYAWISTFVMGFFCSWC